MPLGIGASKSKSKSTQDTNSTSTSTPNNPQWVTDGAQGLAGGVAALQGQDPTSFFAGPSGLQNQQFSLAGGLGGQAAGWLNQAAGAAGQAGNGQANTSSFGGYNPAMSQAAQIGDMAHASAPGAQGVTGAEGMGAYYNPFQQQVANNTTAEMLRARDMVQNSNGQGAQLSGQYGGSRQGVLDANTDRDFYSQLGNTLGNLNLQGFNTAAQYGSQDASRLTQNNQFNSGQAADLSKFNAGADNTAGLTQAGYDQQTGLANQNANNSAWSHNSDVYNQGGMFNAGQQDNAANRQMQSSQLLQALGFGGYDALSGAGGTQQGLNQAQAGAPLSVLQALSGTYGNLPLGLFQGNTTTGNSQMKGTGSQMGLSAAATYAGK